MRQTLLGASAVAAALLVLSACGSENGSSSSSDNDSADLSVESVGGAGSVLVDRAGHPVYTNNVDERTRIRCVGQCAEFWPPVKVTGSVESSVAGVDGTFRWIERPEGGRQVSLDGKPLYTFSNDSGDSVKGEGFTDDFHGTNFTWHVVAAAGSQSSSDGGGYGGY